MNIPLLQILYKEQKNEKGPCTIKGLILTPTRELAIQIGESLTAYERYTGLRHTVIFSGVSQVPQTNALKSGVDILVATPGRLLDLMNHRKDKKSLLIQLLKNRSIDSALVFTRTKHGADKVARDLANARIPALAIRGNKSQMARQLVLNNFKSKHTRVLVATDIAARGIDVQHLSHVINFDLPNVPENYVHRIGRTGRAGLGGIALPFCDREEKQYLRDVQKLISKKIPVIEDQCYLMNTAGK